MAGDAEVLLDQIRTLRDKMKEELGEMVEYIEVKDGIHDCIGLSIWEPEISLAYDALKAWMFEI